MSGLHPVTMQILEAGAFVVAIVFLAAFIGEGIFSAVYDAFARFFSDRDTE
jgi:hypothetical protein